MPAPADAFLPETLARLRDAGLALLPPGRAFTRRLTAMVPRVLEACLVELARVHLEASTILSHISPRRARREDYLVMWEQAAGTESLGTPEERAARAAEAIRRGARVHVLADYDAAAAARGMEITGPVWTYPLFEAGRSTAGEPARGHAWRFYLTFPVSGGSDEERALLGEDFNALKRAHTLVEVGLGVDLFGVIDGSGNPVFDGDDRVVA